MAAVGIRELKNKLGHYLKRVERGEWIEVTNRGKVIALSAPVEEYSRVVRDLEGDWGKLPHR